MDKSVLKAVARAIDFMEGALKEEIGIADAADAAAYSLYHFCRLFNRCVHHTPYDYLIRRRLTEAARELKQTERKIIDIAFDYRFNSHESFCRAFKRLTGMQPNQWRKEGVLCDRFAFSRRTIEHLELIGGNKLGRPELFESPELILAGIPYPGETPQYYDEFIWQKLDMELSSADQPIQPACFYGIRTWLDDAKESRRFDMAAVRVERLADMNPVLATRRIPAGTHLVFSFSGPRQPAFDYIYQTYMPKAGLEPAYPLELEDMGADWRRSSPDEIKRKFLLPVRRSD